MSSLRLSQREDFRHYCPRSEEYAGCDVLLRLLDNGFTPHADVVRERFPVFSGKSTTVYHFQLHKADNELTVSVVDTPVVCRVIDALNLRIVDQGIADRFVYA